MIIYLVKSLPENSQGYYNDYNFRQTSPSHKWTHLDVKESTHKWQKEILDYYLFWHQKLSERALDIIGDDWWLLQQSRLISWYPSLFEPLVYAATLKKLCDQKNIDKIFIINMPLNSTIYLKEFGVNIIDQEGILGEINPQSRLGCILEKFKQLVRFIYYIIIQIGSVIKIKLMLFDFIKNKHCLKNINQPSKEMDLVFSQISSNIRGENVQDHFFGSIDNNFILKKDNPILWILRPIGFSRGTIKRHLTSLNKSGFEGIILEREISVFHILLGIFREISLNRKIMKSIGKLPLINLFGFESRLFLEDYFNIDNSSIDGFVVASFMKKLLVRNEFGRIIYPYEEKVSEKAILINIKMFQPDIETIGYQHASTNQGHLYLNYKSSVSGSFKPDKILTTGPSQKEQLSYLWKWPEEQVDVLGSFRFHKKTDYLRDKSERQKKLRILLIIGVGYELESFDKLIKGHYKLFKGSELLIRPYPYNWIEEQDNTIKKISNGLTTLKISNSSLYEEVEWCDCTLTCSTSAGIESMLMGRINAYIDLNNYLIQDPYCGKFSEEKIHRLGSINDIENFISFMKNLSVEKYNIYLQKQIFEARQIYSQIEKF